MMTESIAAADIIIRAVFVRQTAYLAIYITITVINFGAGSTYTELTLGTIVSGNAGCTNTDSTARVAGNQED